MALVLLLFAACAFVGSYFTSGKSDDFEAHLDRIEAQERQEDAAKGNFAVYANSSRELNWWDFGSVALLVTGSSLTVAAVWLRKR